MKLFSNPEGKQDGITKFSKFTEWKMEGWGIFFVLCFFLSSMCLHAEGRAGAVEWSDGRKATGAISLTPGKELGIFLPTGKVTVPLESVKEISFKPEKEEMREGFYFPNAGQATQAKTGEVYPVRYLQTRITLADGRVLEGHLFTTTFYIESDNATEKLVLMAKQTGANGQKLTDVVYPTAIRFDANAPASGFSEIKMDKYAFNVTTVPVVVCLPDLTLVPVEAVAGRDVWKVPVADPKRLLFALVMHNDGETLAVSWPKTEAPEPVQKAVETALKNMEDYYNTGQLHGCFYNAETNDAYGLVLLSRKGTIHGATGEPWSLVILRWKFDSDAAKCTLLNRVSLRRDGNSALPTVLKDADLLNDIAPFPSIEVHP